MISLYFNNNRLKYKIRLKCRSVVQNNPMVGLQPNPCRMEPPRWPAVSTSQPGNIMTEGTHPFFYLLVTKILYSLCLISLPAVIINFVLITGIDKAKQ